jgi:hypothetical protein
VWFDEYELVLGDSLRGKVTDGLRHSLAGVVILSHSFFAKPWPLWELDCLTARQIAGEPNVILPIWHELGLDEIRSYSLPLADLVAAKSSDGVEAVAHAVIRALRERAAGTHVRPGPPHAQSKRKNVPTGSSLSASIFGTAAASVSANVLPLAPISRINSSTGVASALTPLA